MLGAAWLSDGRQDIVGTGGNDENGVFVGTGILDCPFCWSGSHVPNTEHWQALHAATKEWTGRAEQAELSRRSVKIPSPTDQGCKGLNKLCTALIDRSHFADLLYRVL
eukprot:6308699-Amphidinium_carterae.1